MAQMDYEKTKMHAEMEAQKHYANMVGQGTQAVPRAMTLSDYAERLRSQSLSVEDALEGMIARLTPEPMNKTEPGRPPSPSGLLNQISDASCSLDRIQLLVTRLQEAIG